MGVEHLHYMVTKDKKSWVLAICMSLSVITDLHVLYRVQSSAKKQHANIRFFGAKRHHQMYKGKCPEERNYSTANTNNDNNDKNNIDNND